MDCDPYFVYKLEPWSLEHVSCLFLFHREKLNYTELNLWWLAFYWFLWNVFAALMPLNESTKVKYIIYTMPIKLLTIDSSLNLTFRLHQAHYKGITLPFINSQCTLGIWTLVYWKGPLSLFTWGRVYCNISVWPSVMERESRAHTALHQGSKFTIPFFLPLSNSFLKDVCTAWMKYGCASVYLNWNEMSPLLPVI